MDKDIAEQILAQKQVEYSSVRDLIDRQADKSPGDTFLIDTETGQEITNAELRFKVHALALYIAGQGVKPGDSVAFAMTNGPVCAISILAIIYGGYRCVAINLVAGRDVIAYVLGHSESSLILTTSMHKQYIDEALACDSFDAGAQVPCVLSLDDEQLQLITDNAGDVYDAAGPASGNSSAEIATSTAPLSASSDGLLMYTSGTKGRPKGVVLSHGNLIAGGMNVAIGHELTAMDRALCVLPLYQPSTS